jgi:hypothetical protein
MTTILIVAAVCVGGGGLVAALVYMTQRRPSAQAAPDDDFSASSPPAADWSGAEFSDASPVSDHGTTAAEDAVPGTARAADASVKTTLVPVAAVASTPAAVPAAETGGHDPDDDGLPPHIEKIRVPDVGLLAYVHSADDGPDPLLGFSTEGFAAEGRAELVLYVRRSEIAEDALIPALKRFTAVALTLFERPTPLAPGELLPMSGTYGTVALGGFVVMDAAATGGPSVHVLVGVRKGVDLAQARDALAPGSFVSPVG